VLLAVEEMQKSTEQTAETAMQSTRNASDLRSQVAALADSVKTVDQAVNKLNEQFFGMVQGVAQ
jgi:methyl-accepting chemotaxis protein